MTARGSYRKFIKAMLCAAVVVLGFSTDAAAKEGWTQVFPFMRVQRDPVRAGMGVNGYAYTSAISSASWVNPAAITFSTDTVGISLGYQYWQPVSARTHNITLGTTWNIRRKVGVTFGLLSGFNPAYEVTNELQEISGKFTPKDLQLNLGLGVKLCPQLSIGANFHYTSQELAKGISFYVLSMDAFLMARIRDFSFTAGVSSFGTPLRKVGDRSYAVSDKNIIPFSVSGGIAFRHVFSGGHAIDIVGDIDYFVSSRDISAGGGFGATIAGVVSLRAGYHYGQLLPSHISTGLGFSFFGVHIDAAYLIGMPTSDSPMKNTFCVSAGYCF